jgi:gluconate:H+ symporter, GntP family
VEPDSWALVTLVVGICTVLGMIIVFRVNAFLSLITAAMLVSIMAPGEIGLKIDRVARGFGDSAAGIGIVIALAAVIGQCMMQSGAADRIVRAFMNVLGEKRAPVALMGSGFVLSVPVFFDTVFYLLIPLARSLYRSTRSNYLLYILAICAGGAITHTLVPPTPGPLVMADQLGIDVGLMILVGGLVAMPAAAAGIITARLMNRWIRIDVDMDVPSGADGEPVTDERLPGLFVSLLPVILPVVLISANTAANTLADAEHAARLAESDVTDWQVFSQTLSDTPAGQYILSQLEIGAVPDVSTDASRQELIDAINSRIATRSFYNAEAFDAVVPTDWEIAQKLADDSLSDDQHQRLINVLLFRDLASKDLSRMKRFELERMHRLLLEATFADSLRRHEWHTTRRQVADVFRLLGNANLALLISAAISVVVLWKTRQSSLATIAKGIEESLMSGGAIILITAAGGAFGKMLQVAGVGDAILGLFSTEGSGGLLFLCIGFGIAALMKVAQGSSTTAMIVTSGMMASVIVNADLPFNVVYMATAIGGGSLVGSWMNDSGFWIVARMSGLTEAQALKTWTPLLIVLGVVSFAMTVLLTQIMPLNS